MKTLAEIFQAKALAKTLLKAHAQAKAQAPTKSNIIPSQGRKIIYNNEKKQGRKITYN